MNRTLLSALSLAALAALAAPAAHAGPDCSAAAAAKPMWQVAKSFEDAGGVIREMKLEDGCYEIKGVAGERRLEIYYDPATGVELEREED